MLYYDLIDYDETFFYEEELVSGKPVPAKIEVERQFDANVVLWGSKASRKGWTSNEPGAYVDLHTIAGRVERVDQQHVKYFLDLPPGKKQTRRVQRDLQAAEGRAGAEHASGSGSRSNDSDHAGGNSGEQTASSVNGLQLRAEGCDMFRIQGALPLAVRTHQSMHKGLDNRRIEVGPRLREDDLVGFVRPAWHGL